MLRAEVPDPVTEQGPDVTALLLAQHAAFRSEAAAVADERWPYRRERFRAFVRDLVRHDNAEEEILHPILRRLPGGPAVRAEAARQERELAVSLVRLGRRMLIRRGGHVTRERLLRFGEQLEHHLAFEEAALFPLVAQLEGEQQRRILGTWTTYAERLSPSRPHPHAPRNVPGLVLCGPPLALFDRLLERVLGGIDRDRDQPVDAWKFRQGTKRRPGGRRLPHSEP